MQQLNNEKSGADDKTTTCVFCKSSVDEPYKYYTLSVCTRCYYRLDINKIDNREPPVDKYMRSLVKKGDEVYVDALNLYSTLFPQSLSSDLFGVFFTNLDDKEMDDIFVNSMIIAARSLWLFGKDTGKQKKLKSSKIHALHVLGNLIGISIICNSTDGYKDLDLNDETTLSKLYDKIDGTFLDILNDLEEHDDGTLDKYIIETIHLIRTSDMFR